MKNKNVECVICYKKIKVQEETIGGSFKRYIGSISKQMSRLVSDDGVLFLQKWFCNDCWKEITKDIIKLYKIKGGKTNVDKKR